MRRIALVNQKGGCGKTTTAVNLASCLADEGRRVLLIDLDPQGHAGLGLGVKTDNMEKSIYEVLMGEMSILDVVHVLQKNFHAVFSDVVLSAFEQVMAGVPEREYRLVRNLNGTENHYDYLILDSPPSVGLLTFNGLMASDEVIIPVDPSYFSLHGLGKLLDTIQIIEEKAGHRLAIKILATNIDRRTNFCKRVVETLRDYFPDKCFQTVIHSCTRLKEAASEGKPIGTYDRHCNAFRDYRALTEEIVSQEAQVAARVSERETGQQGEDSTAEQAEKSVVFSIEAPPNAQVKIAGDFNNWKPEGLSFSEAQGRPAWRKLVILKPGSYQYKYLVDGHWVADPSNDDTADDSLGGSNSVLYV